MKDAPFSSEKLFKELPDGYHQDYLELYRGIVDPKRPSLMFVGIFDTLGNTPVVVEMQARWILALLKGEIVLPPEEEMVKAVQLRKKQDIARGGVAPMYRLVEL